MKFATRFELFWYHLLVDLKSTYDKLTKCSSSPRRIVALTEMKGSEDVMTSTRLCNQNTLQNASRCIHLLVLIKLVLKMLPKQSLICKVKKKISWAKCFVGAWITVLVLPSGLLGQWTEFNFYSHERST